MRFTLTHPRLSYSVVGRGPRVLLVMGFSMRGCVWRAQIDGLSDRFEVATFDHRGIGLSETENTPVTMGQIADDVLRVADALGWDRFHLVGVSMGGMAAQEVALRRPDRVASLILVATQPGGPGAFLPPLRSIPLVLGVALTRGRIKMRLTGRLLHPKGSLAHKSPEELEHRRRDAFGVATRREVARAQLAAVRSHDTRLRLGRLDVPTLIVKPTLDRLCRPSHSDALHRLIKGSRLVELEAGHGLIFHAADALNALIAEHVGANS